MKTEVRNTLAKNGPKMDKDINYETLDANPIRGKIQEAISGNLGSSTVLRQRGEGHYHMLEVGAPILIIVREGQKRVRLPNGERLVVNPGEALSMNGGIFVDVTNLPGESGNYLAELLVFSEEIFDTRLPTSDDKTMCQVIPAHAEFEECFLRCVQAVVPGSRIPPQIAKHRFQEMLLWLHSHGIMLKAAPKGIEQRLRKIFSEDTSTEWPVPRILKRLATEGMAMSEATLRRRLAEAGTNVCDIITEVRMERANLLLQTTDWTISRIAAECGYTSPSRFAKRFKEKFGHAPSAQRGNS